MKTSRARCFMPADVAAGMKQSACENDRSLNGEIVRALRK